MQIFSCLKHEKIFSVCVYSTLIFPLLFSFLFFSFSFTSLFLCKFTGWDICMQIEPFCKVNVNLYFSFQSGNSNKKLFTGCCFVSLLGRFHKLIYTLGQALTLCAKLLHIKKASQKFGVERKMALRPTFSLYEIDPRTVRSCCLVVVLLINGYRANVRAKRFI